MSRFRQIVANVISLYLAFILALVTSTLAECDYNDLAIVCYDSRSDCLAYRSCAESVGCAWQCSVRDPNPPIPSDSDDAPVEPDWRVLLKDRQASMDRSGFDYSAVGQAKAKKLGVYSELAFTRDILLSWNIPVELLDELGVTNKRGVLAANLTAGDISVSYLGSHDPSRWVFERYATCSGGDVASSANSSEPLAELCDRNSTAAIAVCSEFPTPSCSYKTYHHANCTNESNTTRVYTCRPRRVALGTTFVTGPTFAADSPKYLAVSVDVADYNSRPDSLNLISNGMGELYAQLGYVNKTVYATFVLPRNEWRITDVTSWTDRGFGLSASTNQRVKLGVVMLEAGGEQNQTVWAFPDGRTVATPQGHYPVLAWTVSSDDLIIYCIKQTSTTGESAYLFDSQVAYSLNVNNGPTPPPLFIANVSAIAELEIFDLYISKESTLTVMGRTLWGPTSFGFDEESGPFDVIGATEVNLASFLPSVWWSTNLAKNQYTHYACEGASVFTDRGESGESFQVGIVDESSNPAQRQISWAGRDEPISVGAVLCNSTFAYDSAQFNHVGRDGLIAVYVIVPVVGLAGIIAGCVFLQRWRKSRS